MDIISGIKKTIPLVISVLKNNIESRDDDNVLLLAIWDVQAISLKKDIKHYHQFREMLLNGELAMPSTVVRTRRRVQLIYPELRGEKYHERQRADTIVRNQIRMNFEE